MEGRIFQNPSLPELSPDEREIAYNQMIIALDNLRKIDISNLKIKDMIIESNIQNTPLTSLVHGEFRFQNVIFHKSQLRIIAILDWNSSFIGNQYYDLASFGLIYHLPVSIGGLGKYDKGMSGIPTEF